MSLELPSMYWNLYRDCRLCPRECAVNRTAAGATGTRGFCREGARLRVSYVGPHFGEEPPITGTRGSGTVFLAGCSLRCSFCQNHQISRGGLGRVTTIKALEDDVERMLLRDRVHNINLVTPDHFLPHLIHLVARLRGRGHHHPVVLNLSGYQARTTLEMAGDVADIYLPDYKYSDGRLAGALSACEDYPAVALEAIAEMVRRRGFLDTLETGRPLARKGVLVRHLILPGKTENSRNALTTLFLEFGPRLPLSLMSQYTPAVPQADPDLNRTLTAAEFDRVYTHALDLGFERLFVQFPVMNETDEKDASPFLPDFRLAQPFSGARNS